MWGQVRTVGDLRELLHRYQPAWGVAGRSETSAPRRVPDGVQPPLPAVASPRDAAVFPRWPWWPCVRWMRVGFLEVVMRPLVWLVLAPRIAPRVLLARPSLLIANHLTAFDVPVILYALSSSDRDHVAVAMSGQLLTGWRRGKAERHRIVAPPHSVGLLAGHCALQCLSLAPGRRIAAELCPRRRGHGSGLPRAGFSRRAAAPPMDSYSRSSRELDCWHRSPKCRCSRS